MDAGFQEVFLTNRILAPSPTTVPRVRCSFGEQIETLNFNIYNINETQKHVFFPL